MYLFVYPCIQYYFDSKMIRSIKYIFYALSDILISSLKVCIKQFFFKSYLNV